MFAICLRCLSSHHSFNIMASFSLLPWMIQFVLKEKFCTEISNAKLGKDILVETMNQIY